MELRAGYKQTEVGVIPEDWRIFRLHELANLTSSKRIFENDYVQTGIPFYRGKEISQLIEGVEIDDVCYITEARYSAIKTQFGAPVKGDILITAVGTLANVYVVDTDSPFYFKDGNLIWLRNIKGVSPLFLGIQLRRAKSAILDGAIGSSQKALTIVVLKELPVALPSTIEQLAITTALSDADALLAAQDKLIAKKRDIKQAAMQQLLTGKQRLPGFSGEWVSCELKRFVREFIVPMRDKPKCLKGHIPWCRIEDFDGMYLTESKSGQNVDEQTVVEMNLKVYPIGTLLVSCSADLGRCAIVGSPLVSNQTFIGLQMDDAVSSSEYFYYYMTARAGELNKLSSGTTISYLSREQFEVFPVFAPPTKDEQSAIATVLSDMDEDIAGLEKQRDKTRALKQGMMQELLTGRIRLV